MEKDEDEACEIDSECDSEESKIHQSRRKKSKLEESIGSSRTATFKSAKGAPNNTNATFTSINQ
jgi:hypothetical protein